jgi:hypothetical protein
MLTDDDLTKELRLAFAAATDGIDPAAGLGAAVHKQHRAARRRAVAIRIAVPAAAACAGGMAIVGTGSSPSSHAPVTRVPTASGTGQSGTGHSVSRPTARTVAYVLKVPTQAPDTFNCLDDRAFSVTRDPDTWAMRVSGRDGCLLMLVDTNTTRPADARPIDLAGVPGLYGTTDERAGTRTIYSRNGNGTWSALTVSADTPDEFLRDFYTPAG